MVKPPFFLRTLFPGCLWRNKTDKKEVYLTFDDGPVPEVTPWVLDEADKWNAKLTFFCVGENVYRYPELFQEVKRRGHQVGNHTYNHLKAWKTNEASYFENIEKAQDLIGSTLFRPPYGQWYLWYTKKAKMQFSQVVMWDILTKDYDRRLSGEQVFNHVKKHLRPGSVVVFHDSVKASENMKYAFSKTLEWINKMGYTTRVIQ